MKNTQLTTDIFSSAEVQLQFKRPLFDAMYFIKSADDAHDCLRSYINPNRMDLKECFWVILLTNANRVIAISEVASGTTKGVQMNPKEILQLALKTNAVAIIISHNHPAGTLKFSANDIKETKKIQRLVKLIDITLLDHIIITSESYLSLAQEGKL